VSKSKTTATNRPPVLWIALGRPRVGKTVLLNKAAEYFSALGISPQAPSSTRGITADRPSFPMSMRSDDSVEKAFSALERSNRYLNPSKPKRSK
jgi:hypothetical protein